MWTTLGYNNDYGKEFCFSEPFHGARKLRPLVPHPPLPSLRARYYHLGSVLNEERRERELNNNDDGKTNSCYGSPLAAVVVSSSRWNPTAEQLRILEELYRRGTRTPSADQIQHITAHLRRFGKIQGKNVFYWFQNHKARERQKRRRLTAAHQTTKHSEAEKGYEIQQTKTKCWWPPLPSPQESGKKQSTRKVKEEEEEEEMIRRRREESVERDCWRWNNNTVKNCQLTKRTTLLNGVVGPETTTTTLQLFPVRTSNREGRQDDDDDDNNMETVSDWDWDSDNLMIKTKISSFSQTCSTHQFFQFLPLKN